MISGRIIPKMGVFENFLSEIQEKPLKRAGRFFMDGDLHLLCLKCVRSDFRSIYEISGREVTYE